MADVEDQAQSLVDMISEAHAREFGNSDDPNARAAAKLRRPYLGAMQRGATPEREAGREDFARTVLATNPMASALMAGREAGAGQYGQAAQTGINAVLPPAVQKLGSSLGPIIKQIGPKIAKVAKEHPKELMTILGVLGIGAGTGATAQGDERVAPIPSVDERLEKFMQTPAAKQMLEGASRPRANKLIQEWRAKAQEQYNTDVRNAEGAGQRAYKEQQERKKEEEGRPFTEKYPTLSAVGPYALTAAESAASPWLARQTSNFLNKPEMMRWLSQLGKVETALQKPTAKTAVNQAKPFINTLKEFEANPPKMGKVAKGVGYGLPIAMEPFAMAAPQEIDLLTAAKDSKAKAEAEEKLSSPAFWAQRAGFGTVPYAMGSTLGSKLPTLTREIKPPMQATRGAIQTFGQKEIAADPNIQRLNRQIDLTQRRWIKAGEPDSGPEIDALRALVRERDAFLPAQGRTLASLIKPQSAPKIDDLLRQIESLQKAVEQSRPAAAALPRKKSATSTKAQLQEGLLRTLERGKEDKPPQ